ncbi:MAG TPA: nodulation protein NfeD [Candidatus Limnocylindrales bacterium]|nr:nodulation protein NfeD [Candidatus Limnocylindrales bacterium]
MTTVTARAASRLSALLFLLGVLLLPFGAARGAQAHVVVLPTTGIVDQVMSGYVREGIARAGQRGAAAVVVKLNTPGGSLDATQAIVSAVLEAPLPVIVWVAPPGGRAASAGTFITLAGHVALMAPGTNIGAASPVGGQGEDIEGTLGDKVLNDAVANITSIAQARGRNVEWAVATVREAKSSPAEEAVAVKAVDGLAADLGAVLAFAHGRQVKVGSGTITLDLAGATSEELAMNPLQAFLHLLADPNIAFILFTLGFYGLLFELQNPNFVTGILGALAIILAFVGFGSLPLNVAGLLLIGLAIVLFALELTVTSHGLLTVAGLVCLALGAAALYTEPGGPTAPNVAVALPVLLTVLLLTGGFMALIVAAAVRSRRMRPSPGLVGTAIPAGTVGEVRLPLGPYGSVYAGGEEWTARTADDQPLPRGTPVRVVRQDGLTIVVERADPSGSGA